MNKLNIECIFQEPKITIHLVAEKIERDKTIIRIRDARLSEIAGYALTKKVSVEYEGTPYGLVKFLSTKDPLIRWPRVVVTGSPPGIDTTTPIKVAVTDTPIRDLLTDCIPLSVGYNRIIWSSYTAGKTESPDVTVEFYGRGRIINTLIGNFP